MPAIVFDLDGTLVHSAPDVLDALARALESVGVSCPATLPHSLIGPPIQEMVDKLGIPISQREKEAAVLAFRKIYDGELQPRTNPYPGATKILRELRAAGWGIYLATNKPTVPTRRLVGRFFSGLFDDLCCVDSCEGRRLTKTEMIGVLMDRYDLHGQASSVVGDGVADLRAGRELGCTTVAVGWGYGLRDELEAEAPDHWVETFAQLGELLLPRSAVREASQGRL